MSIFRPSRSFHFPGPRDRVAVIGSTGSGKSHGAFWLASESADFDKKPWIFVDYKGEDIIAEMLERKDARLIGVEDDLPEKPGLYVMKPTPHQQPAVAAWLWRVWERGKTGLIFDEISMIPELRGEANSGGPLKSILTQGRSKEIPVYSLIQRPVDVNKHVFTEAQFIWQFHLKHDQDLKKVLEYIPSKDEIFRNQKRLPRYWSRWYDDVSDASFLLKPVPDKKEILDRISERLEHMRHKQRV